MTDMVLPKFDPAAVSKQIDSMMSAIPPGQKAVLMAQVDWASKKASAALVVRLGTHVGAYTRVTKVQGGGFDADSGVRISFLVSPSENEFSYRELVQLLRYRGFGLFSAMWNARKILRGGSVEL